MEKAPERTWGGHDLPLAPFLPLFFFSIGGVKRERERETGKKGEEKERVCDCVCVRARFISHHAHAMHWLDSARRREAARRRDPKCSPRVTPLNLLQMCEIPPSKKARAGGNSPPLLQVLTAPDCFAEHSPYAARICPARCHRCPNRRCAPQSLNSANETVLGLSPAGRRIGSGLPRHRSSPR